ncbi:SMI1/KNR4 family protein [Anatilimnocola sp. NA78]|uniref:SMI1/KNR4 family protein n=1 Tax=Anatilimnocola sp. NA78 TaxID=3415683 RepID=UPI003CE521BE
MLTSRKLVDRIVAAGLAKHQPICGAFEVEIASLETTLGVALPEDYRSFLKAVGHSAGAFWDDVDFRVKQLVELQSRAKEMVANWEDGKLPIPNNAFVFAMRQGEQFMFFETGTPLVELPIYFYFEGRGAFSICGTSFWDVIEAELNCFESSVRDLQ